MFGVSRTGIREAIRTLAGQGLVDIRGRNGAYVSEIEVSHLVNPYSLLLRRKCGEASHLYLNKIRLLFEPDIARLAALNRTEEDLDNLRKSLTEMQEERSNPDNMIQKDIDFHKNLAMATRNPLMPIIMGPIFHLLPEFISDNYKLSHNPDEPIEEHQRIIKSLEQGDPDKAYETMKIHMQTAERHVLEYYRNIGIKDFQAELS
jgi:GntR family transcriptional repressor for pyruvate dehydrogenase complex